MTSKRRSNKINLLSLSFVTKCMTKAFLIKILKRDNQLHLFRRIEQCSKRLISSQCAVEFLKLCQNFGLTPTFAKVANQKTSKWKQASKNYEENIISEEIKQKRDQIIV